MTTTLKVGTGGVVTGTRYVIQDKYGNLIALDKASGGYPYPAYSLRDVNYWNTFEDAHKYWKVFENGTATDDGWKIKEATLTVKGIPST